MKILQTLSSNPVPHAVVLKAALYPLIYLLDPLIHISILKTTQHRETAEHTKQHREQEASGQIADIYLSDFFGHYF